MDQFYFICHSDGQTINAVLPLLIFCEYSLTMNIFKWYVLCVPGTLYGFKICRILFIRNGADTHCRLDAKLRKCEF